MKTRIEEKGWVGKGIRGAFDISDMLTGGAVRALRDTVLARGNAQKLQNVLELENKLKKNLEVINKAMKAPTEAKAVEILNTLPKEKGMLQTAIDNLKDPKKRQGGYIANPLSKKPSVKDASLSSVNNTTLQITPKLRENPQGFYKVALEAKVPEEIKPVLLRALGDNLDSFKKGLKSTKYSDVRAGLDYMEKNGISADDVFNMAQKETQKPIVLPSLETRVVPPKYITEIQDKIDDLKFDPDTSNYDNEMLSALSKELKDMDFKDFQRAVKFINNSSINGYIKNELTDIVKKYQRVADKQLPKAYPQGLLSEAKKYKSAEEFVKAQSIGNFNEKIVKLAQDIEKRYPSTGKVMSYDEGATVFFNELTKDRRVLDEMLKTIRNSGDSIGNQVDIESQIIRRATDVYNKINSKQILTKSQLEDIWKQAQGKSPKK